MLLWLLKNLSILDHTKLCSPCKKKDCCSGCDNGSAGGGGHEENGVFHGIEVGTWK